MFNLNVFKKLNELTHVNPREYSPLALAYIGDAIYEIYIRDHVIKKANAPVNKLHTTSKKYVKASAQAQIYHFIKDLLTENELAILKRGRNAKSASSPKNGDIREYRLATGVEALIGFLYLNNEIERLTYIINTGIAQIERED